MRRSPNATLLRGLRRWKRLLQRCLAPPSREGVAEVQGGPTWPVTLSLLPDRVQTLLHRGEKQMVVRKKSPVDGLDKADLEELSEFRYRLRRFLRFSEEIVRAEGIT